MLNGLSRDLRNEPYPEKLEIVPNILMSFAPVNNIDQQNV